MRGDGAEVGAAANLREDAGRSVRAGNVVAGDVVVGGRGAVGIHDEPRELGAGHPVVFRHVDRERMRIRGIGPRGEVVDDGRIEKPDGLDADVAHRVLVDRPERLLDGNVADIDGLDAWGRSLRGAIVDGKSGRGVRPGEDWSVGVDDMAAEVVRSAGQPAGADGGEASDRIIPVFRPIAVRSLRAAQFSEGSLFAGVREKELSRRDRGRTGSDRYFGRKLPPADCREHPALECRLAGRILRRPRLHGFGTVNEV